MTQKLLIDLFEVDLFQNPKFLLFSNAQMSQFAEKH